MLQSNFTPGSNKEEFSKVDNVHIMKLCKIRHTNIQKKYRRKIESIEKGSLEIISKHIKDKIRQRKYQKEID